MVRSIHRWQLNGHTLALGGRTLVMGILNVTPDSFSDGSLWLAPADAVRHALEMLDEGADLIDLGGESTRPGALPVPPHEEQGRVLPVLQEILRQRPEAVVSVDTYRAETARLAIEMGAALVNDVSGGLWDERMHATCAALRCGLVLMHTRGRPQEWKTLPPLAPGEVVPLVLRDLRTRVEEALAAGVRREAIALDPGFGFGKIMEENWPLLAGFRELVGLGFPLVAGVSRKGFLRAAIGGDGATSDPEALRESTVAANTASILAGAHLLRVHDVASGRRAAAVADRMLAAGG